MRVKCVMNLCLVSQLQSMLSLVTLIVLLMVFYTVIFVLIPFLSILVLVLKYDQCHISTNIPVCLFIRHLTSLTKKGGFTVFLCDSQSHAQSHIYDQLLASEITRNFRKYDINVAWCTCKVCQRVRNPKIV